MNGGSKRHWIGTEESNVETPIDLHFRHYLSILAFIIGTLGKAERIVDFIHALKAIGLAPNKSRTY